MVERVYHTQQSTCVNKHNFYIDQAIQYAEVYREMIDVLLTAPDTDEIHLYINTPGGSASIGINIVNAMRNCRAKITGHLMAECHSMGTFIFLECDEYVVNEDILLLFHAYSGWNFGKGNDSVISAQKNHKWLAEFFRKVYYPFFSYEEIETIMPEDGQGATDYYLYYDDMVTRLKNVMAWREQQDVKAEAEHLKAVLEALKEDKEDGSEDTETLHTPSSEEPTVSDHNNDS